MISVNEENFEEVVLRAIVPVLLDVFGYSCPPCRRIMPLIEQLSDELEGRAVVAKFAYEDQPRLAGKLGVTAVPTFIVFNEGAEVHRMVGLQSREKLLASLGLTTSVG
jgi:thioredoxin 1